MGISKISISNFQSHRETVLDLHPGVNLIVGSSDSGKTAIIRALKWLATNRPLGDGFVSWDSKGETIVEVLFDDGASIRHELGKYSLKNGKDKQDWSAIGTTVPEAVTQALNISDLSWQAQMDPPFLLSASPGEVARTLNEVADLDKIDSTLVNINRMARDNRAQLTETAQAKQQLGIDLSAFRELDNQLAKITQLKEMERKAGLLEEMVTEGGQLVISIAEQEEALTHYGQVEKHLALVHKLNEQISEYETIGTGIRKGQRMLDEFRELTDRLKAIKDPADAEAELDLLLDMVGKSKELERDIKNIQVQLNDIQDARVSLAQVAGSAKRLESQWHEQFPEVCPLCGRSG
jgi:exonuclease SbcC